MESLIKGTKLIETLQNYSVLTDSDFTEQNENLLLDDYIMNDEMFWDTAFNHQESLFNSKFDLIRFVVSDWVARVPGLFWAKSSRDIRKRASSEIAIQSENWTEFYPLGKSMKVMGGIGTICLPPSEDGKRLMSISAGHNASSGIPILVYPEVIDELKLKQGDVIDLNSVKWQSMSVQWANNFASTKNIPRGYFVIDSIDQVEIVERDYPVLYHPFSLMEYESDQSLLYDFVYVSADSKARNIEAKVEGFFNEYASKDGRFGKYLLNPNIVSPLFETRYNSPADLNHPTEKANLNLLYARIREAHFKEQYIEKLISKIPEYYQSSTSIRTLTKQIGLNPSLLTEDTAVGMSAQLIDSCITKEMIETLIDKVSLEYPKIFKHV